ncbi:uncharacterized protein ACJ7VT_019730 [Polymixia lowei]
MESRNRPERRRDSLYLLSLLVLAVPACTGVPHGFVFVSRVEASNLLQRTRRANSIFEELKFGDLERECLEERCSREEAREIFTVPDQLDTFWKTYSAVNHCDSGPCLNGGTCEGQINSYICICRRGYQGRNCEKATMTSYGCLYRNGGCEQFCTEVPGNSHRCHCAPGYSLANDNSSCKPQVPVPCGRTVDRFQPRVVRGSICPRGQCPWQALLLEGSDYKCGAIVLHPRWILTAAHCVRKKHPNLLNVTVGEHDRYEKEGSEQTRRVSQVLVHPNYNHSTSDSDLALLKLQRPVVLGPFVVPVCLPASDGSFGRTLAAVRTSTVSGWGRLALSGPPARFLQRLEIPRVPLQECRAHSKLNVTRNMLCAGLREGGRDACQGDSGGPLVTRYKNTWFLTGVVSWGKGCAHKDLYGIYTRVSNFLQWIDQTMWTGLFLHPERAHGLLVRTRRFNSGWFEELQKGDLRRECLEEKCSYEEAREVFEHTEATDEFWKTYNVPDSCVSNPCQNGGTCSNQDTSYTCFCPPEFSGLNCELEYRAVPDNCLMDNGGCEHYCEEGAGRRSCSCAEGYFLDADGQSCLAQEPIACGMVPVLQGSDKEDQVDPRARIVGGTECPKGHCPWQVLLVYKGKGFCGGVIYKPTWILTASHCLEDSQVQFLQVVAGEHNTEVDENTEQFIQVVEIVMHEAYVSRTADSDIALLRLATPIVYTPYAVPACLPTRPLAERELWAVSMHTVSGWGRRSEHGPTSHLLRRLRVPRIRTQQCVEESGVALTQNMFCAGYIEGQQDSCKGDSGGPLVTRYRNTVFLLGIVSWGKGCARPGNYGIYTRVSNYLDWIHNRTALPVPAQNLTEALIHNL